MIPARLAADLADAAVRASTRAGAADPAVRGADWQFATVDTVAADGTITTTDGIPVRRMDTYQHPQPGDEIRITQNAVGNWVTDGRVVPTSGDGWTALPLLGAWVPNGGGSDPAPACRYTPDGLLQLSGMIKGTAVAAGANANIATVPAPPQKWIRGLAPTSVAQNWATVAINPVSGTISITNGPGPLLATSWIQLDPIHGRAR
ncbi:hypothetical protein ACWEFL_02890 [Streptomyces sp. NPDC004838]